jgi:hypothetical protein
VTTEKRPRCYSNKNRHYSHLPSTTKAATHFTIIAAGPEEEQQITHIHSTLVDLQATFQPNIPTVHHPMAQPLEVAQLNPGLETIPAISAVALSTGQITAKSNN